MSYPERDPEFAKLYPHLSPEQLEEAEDRFDQYLALAMRVFDRISEDPVQFAELKRMLSEAEKERAAASRISAPTASPTDDRTSEAA